GCRSDRTRGRATVRSIIFIGPGECDASTPMRERAMTEVTRRKLVQSGAAGTVGAMASPSLALAQNKRWRMVTSWPKRLPGPGMSAERVAERIKSMSGGRLDIAVHAAGEVV